MTEEIIAFVGSDARDLYKTNIFRALALPDGYVWQFRYRHAWIHGSLHANLRELEGKAAALFFATGNDLAVPEAQRTLTYHPIRHVIIRQVEDDPLLGVVHFFLEMGQFANIKPLANTPADKLSPKCLVTKVTTEPVPTLAWADRVKSLAPFFPNQLFFHIAAVKKNGKVVPSSYSKHDHASRYPLTEETGYQIEIAFYDPKGGKTGLAVENSHEDASLNVPSGHYVGTELNRTTFPLHTHTLARRQLVARTVLKEREVSVPLPTNPPVNPPANPPAAPATPVFDVQLEWSVTRGGYKPWLFGGLAILAALGVALGKLATDDLSKLKLESGNFWLAVAAIACVGLPAGALYWLFHKK